MKAIVVISVVLAITAISSSIGFSQVSEDEAAAKLKAKQAERAIAAAQPSKLTQGEADALIAEVNKLKAECAALRKDIADLKKAPKPAAPKAAPAPPVPANPDRAKRYQEIIEYHKSIVDEVKARAVGANPVQGDINHYVFRTQYDKDKLIERETRILEAVHAIAAANPSAWSEYLLRYPEEHLIGKNLKDAQAVIGVPLKKTSDGPEIEVWQADLGYSPRKDRKGSQIVRLNVSVKTGEVVNCNFTISSF